MEVNLEPVKNVGFIKRVLPVNENTPNDVFVNNHTKLTSTFAKCRKFLDQKTDYLILHGMGKSISKTIRLANLLKDSMKGSITVNVRTGTIVATDILYGQLDDVDSNALDNVRKRPVSVIHIQVARVFT